MAKEHLQMTSVGKALALIDILAQENSPLTLKELSELSGWAKSTVHGLLSSLRAFRMVSQDSDGRYRLGMHLFELGSIVSSQWDISAVAKPHMQNIRSKINEAVCLALFDGDSVIVIDSISAINPMRLITDVGARFPLHASALGKAILANQSEEKSLTLAKQNGLSVYTRHTISDLDSWLIERQKILECGYAVEDGEMRIGMRAVASPVFDATKKARYAIGVTGMFRNTNDPVFQAARDLVLSAANECSRKMSEAEI